MPTIASMPPTGAKSNIVKEVPVNSARIRDTTMFGEMPIWVIRPPSSAANAIGMRYLDGETPDFLANWKATGIMIARAPMFFIKEESTATTIMRSASCACIVFRFGKSFLIAMSTIPDRATPALTTKALPTMTTISSAKPEKALSAGTMPIATAVTRPQQATTS
ncbi:hypothetical protein ABIA24_005466 [Sinorhizobium fredii]